MYIRPSVSPSVHPSMPLSDRPSFRPFVHHRHQELETSCEDEFKGKHASKLSEGIEFKLVFRSNLFVRNYHSDFWIIFFFLRFTSEADTGWFTRTMTRVVAEDLGETYLPLLEPTHYFVDFLK